MTPAERREAIARIVDPEGWELADQKQAAFPNDPLIYETVRLKRSLSKAEHRSWLWRNPWAQTMDSFRKYSRC